MHDSPAHGTFYLGYDIGGTKIAVCAADTSGRILGKKRIATGTCTPYEEVLPAIIEAGHTALRDAGLRRERIAGCGISAPGPLDIANGKMLKSSNMVWRNVSICRDLASAFGHPVTLKNDANAGALAEKYFGAGRPHENIIYLTMSTGVGGGVIANGKLIEGKNGNAAELGHIVLDPAGPPCGCGMHGCLEAFCGGRNVGWRLRQEMERNPCDAILNMPEVQHDPTKLDYIVLRRAVERGIPAAQEFWDDLCFRLAQGIGAHIMTFDPEVVILGTVALYSGDLLMKPLQSYLPRFAWSVILEGCALRVTALGKDIGELSGIAVAKYADPSSPGGNAL